ncbi:hypothetical protein A5739_14000 [Mycobacterium colombiense]|uniref:DUF262 domain-containing protein n=1 Tax=Mycobacterium colombiense TaxID=339268 RepID=UPI00096E5342|nr:DUF262 domain-containing protein [Mycobacterium colombiense]OMC31099.1 hypothetical protein A5739_14000 [Mycobacterium colombiense]
MTGAYDADPVFQANPAHLDYLLQRIHNGVLTIPDFQRDFTWEPRRTATLLRSLMSRFPAGTFLFWAVGPDNDKFGYRPVEGAPPRTTMPQELILDGQQRLTCLYRALNRVGDERFFLSIQKFVDLPSPSNVEGRLYDPQEVEFEDAVFWCPVESKEAKALDARSSRISQHVFAVDEHRQFDDWLDEYASHHSTVMDEKATKTLLRKFRDTYLIPLRSYGFPVVTLPSTTRIEAVATVFETLNSTGKALGPFELLTARFYPEKVHLRDLWEQAIADHPILDVFSIDAYSLLQAVTLRAHNSAQRSDVLRKLTAGDVETHWEAVARGYARSLELLQAECGVVAPNLLPYTMLLVPMAAIWDDISKVKGPEQANVLGRLKQYFWCTVFSTNYDQGANSQAGADYAKLRYWLFDPAKEAPEAVREFALSATALLVATTRRKALYAGVLALTVTSGARDFHSGLKLTADRVKSDKIDSHHVFPKAYLSGKKDKQGRPFNAELILNRALIDPVTNKTIGSKAPSDYFQALREAIEEQELVEILRSQLIDADEADDPIHRDDYTGFIAQRLNDVVAAIESVTNCKVSTEQAE